MAKESSEEVRIKIVDSSPPENSYWNLRGGEEKDERRYNEGSKNNHSNEKDDSGGTVRVEFNLDETRKLTEAQKKTILATLSDNEIENHGGQRGITEDQKEEIVDALEDEEKGSSEDREFVRKLFKEAPVIPALLLLGLFFVLTILAAALANGFCI